MALKFLHSHHICKCPLYYFFFSFLQPLMLNTLGVRSAIGSRRKLSFRNVSNVVMQLLHTIKFSEPVPFSNMATGSFPSSAGSNAGPGADKARKVSTLHLKQFYFFILFFCFNFIRIK